MQPFPLSYLDTVVKLQEKFFLFKKAVTFIDSCRLVGQAPKQMTRVYTSTSLKRITNLITQLPLRASE